MVAIGGLAAYAILRPGNTAPSGTAPTPAAAASAGSASPSTSSPGTIFYLRAERERLGQRQPPVIVE
ncbi:MAG: hypothetical protein A3H97_04465 [Acidobacteria bacterium RIFCSPLOWO2_02_FULL_65_29]|nr:MAG: hypothetical protein A3H97_04465 [Acidobacteria bacterium RIFCSPLOWO2_02_FULL_65_29]